MGLDKPAFFEGVLLKDETVVAEVLPEERFRGLMI